MHDDREEHANDNDPGEPYELANLAWRPDPERPDIGLLSGHSRKFMHLSFTASLIDDVSKQPGWNDSRIVGFTVHHTDEPHRSFTWTAGIEDGDGWEKWNEDDKLWYEGLAVFTSAFHHVEDKYGREPQAVIRENLLARTIEAVKTDLEQDAQTEAGPDRGLDR